MILNNPFSDYGGIVEGDRFIGRSEETKMIQGRLLGSSFGNLGLMGLPRIGKSSLAWNAIMVNKDKLLLDNIIPIWIPLGEFENLMGFFDEVFHILIENLDKIEVNNQKISDLYQDFKSSSEMLEKKRYIKKVLRLTKSDGFRIILIIDEFDNAINIFKHSDFQFIREISYNLELKIGLLTISRKTIQEIEIENNGNISNLYQTFTDLRLKMFNDSDMISYYKRVEGYKVNVSKKYRNDLKVIAGRHPYMLDVINFEIFNHISQTNLDLDETFNKVSEELRLKILNEFESIINLLKQEKIFHYLIQLVVGPKFDIKPRDIERLLKYDMVYPHDSGVYKSFSDDFDDYLKTKDAEIDYWPIWTKAEKKVRNLIKDFLHDRYGEDWEEKYQQETLSAGKTGALDKLRNVRDKSVKRFGSLASPHLVDHTYPLDMWNLFISGNYPWFKRILGDEKKSWGKRFNFLAEIRNPISHSNHEFVSSEQINHAKEICNTLLDKIQKWYEFN